MYITVKESKADNISSTKMTVQDREVYPITPEQQEAIESGGFVYIDDGVVVVEETERNI